MSESLHTIANLDDPDYVSRVRRTSWRVCGALIVALTLLGAIALTASTRNFTWAVASFGVVLVIASAVAATLYDGRTASLAQRLLAPLFGLVLLGVAVVMYLDGTFSVFM